MASTIGIPEADPREEGYGEDEPLLGRVGDASQQDGRPLYYNLMIGTAVIAQGGIILLTALIWTVTLLSPLRTQLFAAHPLLNSTGILAVTQSIIILQPTHTADQKRKGTLTHAVLNNVAMDALVAGFIIIEYNKFSHDAAHFTSAHGILGLITYILLGVQASIGLTQYFVPQLYGGVNNAKAMYKWHRISGYVILVAMLATVAAATQTDTVAKLLKLKLWSVLVCAALILIGIVPRIKKQKFGLGLSRPSGAFGQ